ncbi:MAG TPA: hypothetical protein VEK75_12400 [Xanthobacteraceae bacterium]|nr:hypothetical protein [Xanthobacteraceae bacterium]
MSPTKIGVAVERSLLMAVLLVVSGAPGAAAATGERLAGVHRTHATSAAHRRYARSPMPRYGYYIHGQYVPGAGDTLIHGPGYVFVPGHGILDEDCDLPTSTCSNEYRPVK